MKSARILLRVTAVIGWVLLCAAILYSTRVYDFFTDKNALTIVAWGDIFDPAILAEFQKETGIKINVSYYSSNEELLAKLKKTNGKGFDLIVPSDYAVQLLHEQNLLKKIDKTKLNFYSDLNPVLLGHSYDPQNDYSVPLFWELFGVGVDETQFTLDEMRDPWKLLFEPTDRYKVTMVNDPIEMVMLTSLYLFGNTQELDQVQLQQVKQALLKQKPFVKAYVDFRADYFLATKNCAAVVSSSSYILRSQKQFPFIKFLVPQKTFVTIENCALSVSTQHEDKVYQLLNYIYRPESVVSHCEQFAFFPCTLSALPLLQGNPQQHELAGITAQKFSDFLFFKKPMDQMDLIRMWARIKS